MPVKKREHPGINDYQTQAGKRYRVRYRTPDNRSTDKSGFTTLKAAKEFQASVTVSKIKGEYLDPADGRISIADLMAQWTASRADLTPTSRERLEGIVRLHIVPKLGAYQVAQLRHGELQKWASGLSETQGASSVRKIVFSLSSALEGAVRDRRIPANPASKLRLPSVAKGRKQYLTHEQVTNLADATDAKVPGHGYGVIVRVLSYCGLRWSELSGLRVGDVDFVRGRLEVQHTVTEAEGVQHEGVPKSHEARSVPVPPRILAMLHEQADGRDTRAPLFPGSRRGGWLRNRTFRNGAFNDAAAEVGLEGLTPHELRHTAASLAISVGANVKAVQRMLGHASAAVTLDTYADLFEDDLDAVSTALDHAMVDSIEGFLWVGPKKTGRPKRVQPV